MKKQLLILLIVPLVLGLCAFCLPAQYDETFLGGLAGKLERLETAEAPRLITLGGSGAAFGQDSGLLEEAFPGYTAVNLGLYAATGTKVLLELTLPRLQPGDVVILTPEENAQTLSPWFGAEAVWQAADGQFALLRHLDGTDARELAGAFPLFAGAKLRLFLTGKPQGEGVYRRDSFDARGDIRPELRPANVLPAGYDPTTPVCLTEAGIGEGFFPMVNAFAAQAEARGARVFFRLAPVNALAVREGDAEGFYALLAAGLDMPILGDPRESVLEADWFYDTNFHLNAAGARLNTIRLIRALKAELGDSRPTDYPLPEPPSPQRREAARGDDSMADWFTYAPFGGGWTVTGVLPGAPERLVVPSRYEEKPVLAVESLACEAAEITLPPSLTAIGDNAFSGCPRLTVIRLTAEDPAQTQVGQALLEGTDATLHVPAQAAEAYRVSYFWSPYAGRIVGE